MYRLATTTHVSPTDRQSDRKTDNIINIMSIADPVRLKIQKYKVLVRNWTPERHCALPDPKFSSSKFQHCVVFNF